MAKDELKIDSRRRNILDLLRRDGEVRVTELSQLLGTTVVTVRSDLTVLERDGYCRRIPGGAIRTAPRFTGLELRHRIQQREQQKKSIAVCAVNLVSDGDTLMINSGTTTYLTAMELKKRKNLSVVTNSLSIAVELSAVPGFRVVLIGGNVNSDFAFTFGHAAVLELSQFKANSAILSVDGISGDKGMTTLHAEEAEVNRTMMERSTQTIVVADSSKIDRESFFNFADLSPATHLVTNRDADADGLQVLQQLGLQVHLC